MVSMRNFRQLQLTDDIGELRGKGKTSEMKAEVKCHNHAYQVALQRQLDHWFREQTVAVNKLSRMQQTSFQNLIKVQNEKRKIQRQKRIKRQKELQQRLREQATKDREEAMRRSLELSLSIKRQTQKRKRANFKKFQSIGTLNEIREETNSDEEDVESTKDSCRDSAIDLNNSLPSQSESGKGSSNISLMPIYRSLALPVSTAPNPPIDLGDSAIDGVFLENSVSSEVKKFSADQMAKQKATVLPAIERTDFQARPQSSNSETTQFETKTMKVLPPINPSESQHTKSPEKKDSKSPRKITDSVKERQKRIELVEDMQKYHVGIANRRFKIPENDIPQVSSVKKYSKMSDGSYQSTEVTVRPAAEDFKLPTKKPDYLIAKALLWEKEKEEERERKVRNFLSKQKEFEENNPRQSPEEDRSSATPEEPRNGYNRSRRQSTYITLNDSIHHKALLGVIDDKDDLRNCRYLRIRDSLLGMDNANDNELSRNMFSVKKERREKLSSWGKLSSVRAHPQQNGQYYYVSLL
ncbi:hypothetical protein HOLleu_30954 [Holothuria leucospilota]|uniref:Uncharacterized protein n=1 Tax=Holothuria leucospilota TaxID=206669 RepID=A0A9Q1BLF0_HOLLE|nr:hypothetical protein HOLleu_30954 [Holothuria leucospilota]